MNRRLYFLFPDLAHVRSGVAELKRLNIHEDDINVYARGDVDLSEFHIAGRQVIREASGKAENVLWNVNLLVFFIALPVFVLLLLFDLLLWAIVPAAIMVLTLLAGNYFTSHIPHVHLDEFRDALRHGEILVMVDLPRRRVYEVEHALRAHHPEVTTGGVGWTLNPLHH